MKRIGCRTFAAYAFFSWFIAFVCVLAPSFGSVSSILAQSGITVTAEVDQRTISIDDLLTLALTVGGDYQKVEDPQLPLFTGFSVVGSSRSSQFSMINGMVSARTVFTYKLQPTASGDFTIDPIAIVVDGSTYYSDPIALQVIQGAAPPQTSEQDEPSGDESLPEHSPAELDGVDFHVEADVDNAKPFLGEQITYRFRFYLAVNLFDQPRLQWPNFGGFWAESLTPNRVHEQTSAGRQYRVTEVRKALFPTTVGPASIAPTELTIPGGFFGRDTVLKTERVQVEVQPLPSGAPDEFAGVVGKYEITAWAEPVQARVNEPVTLFVRIQGTGNVTTLPDPSEELEGLLPDARFYDAQVTTDVSQEGDTVHGEKVFERLLVPTRDGTLEIPSLRLVYFDPDAGDYLRSQTEPLVISVSPAESAIPGATVNGSEKQNLAFEASDIRHIKAAAPSLAVGRTNLMEQPVYWLAWILPASAVVGVWIWDRRRRRLSSDVAFARAQRARQAAKKRLSQARKSLDKNNDVAYSDVARALTGYLGDKFNLASAGLTRDTIQRTLTAHNAPTDLIERTLYCLDSADSGRFSPYAEYRDSESLIAEAESLIAQLEQIIQQP